jgi:hypothetical protein
MCVAPSCTDGVRNGQETGLDCGGPACSKCAGGEGCNGAADCASGTCAASVCAASCFDNVKDGDETGKDCGGSCNGCPPGDPCKVNGDCASKICTAGVCAAPSCSDGVQNGTESDIDCGKGCIGCALGQKCNFDSDCDSHGCRNGLCTEVLLISETRTNGPNPDYFGDDFVEFYNPGNTTVTLDSNWELWHRSTQAQCQGKVIRYRGKGQLIPPHHHFLLGGLSYAGPPMDDLFLGVDPTQSISDAACMWILHSGQVIESICYYYPADPGTLDRLTGACPAVDVFYCQGTPMSNFPHDGNAGGAGSVDASIERRPGFPMGNDQDTHDTATDFKLTMPANPQNLASPPTP